MTTTKKDWEKELGILLMDIYIKQKKPSCQNYPLGQLSERVGAFIRNLLDTQKKEYREEIRKEIDKYFDSQMKPDWVQDMRTDLNTWIKMFKDNIHNLLKEE